MGKREREKGIGELVRQLLFVAVAVAAAAADGAER
jgi:hypothetical protein